MIFYSDSVIFFLNYEQMIGSTRKTMQHYNSILGNFREVVQVRYANDLTLDHVYQFSNHLADLGLSVSSRANYLRHVKVFYHYLCNNGIIAEKSLWREIKLPKEPKKIVPIYDNKQISQIYEGCRTPDLWLTARNRCIVSLMLDCGLRLQEVCNVRFSDLSDSNLIVHGKGRKDRIVSLGKQAKKDLDVYLWLRPAAAEDHLLLTRNRAALSGNSVKQLFSRISQKVGFPVSAHRLRHNFATNYLLDSYDRTGSFDCYSLMLLLGHEEVKTTERYLHYCQQLVSSRCSISHLDKINGCTV